MNSNTSGLNSHPLEKLDHIKVKSGSSIPSQFQKKTVQPEIRVELINPFIQSVEDIFHNLLGFAITRQNLNILLSLNSSRDIVAFIGLSGAFQGTVALAFPVKTALKLVGTIYQTDIVVIDSSVIDGVAEIVNMVAGGAQSGLVKGGTIPVDLSIPTVVRGHNFFLEHQTKTAWVEIPFESAVGNFSMQVTMRQNRAYRGES